MTEEEQEEEQEEEDENKRIRPRERARGQKTMILMWSKMTCRRRMMWFNSVM